MIKENYSKKLVLKQTLKEVKERFVNFDLGFTLGTLSFARAIHTAPSFCRDISNEIKNSIEGKGFLSKLYNTESDTTHGKVGFIVGAVASFFGMGIGYAYFGAKNMENSELILLTPIATNVIS